MADLDPGKLRFGPEIMARLEQLGSISHDHGALSRHFLTPEHKAAGELIKSWMEEAGMQAGFDAIGNVVGRYEGVRPGLPTVLTGSHFDTVRNAGKYDGMLGVVTSIAGANRFVVRVEGQAGHAGTVPMDHRQDAATAAAEMLLFIEKRCQGTQSLVGTVGVLNVPNGATNVIPGVAEFTIDTRAGDDAIRKAAVADVLWEIEAIAARRKVNAVVTPQHDAHASPCAPWIMEHIAEQIRAEGIEPRYLASGAGHDGMAISDMTDIGMLFVRCGNGGIRHHPAETMTMKDADLGARIFLNVLRNFKPKAAG